MENQVAVTSKDKSVDIQRRKSRMLFLISQMPPKSHWPDKPEKFDVMNSEVCKWLSSQPEFMDWCIQKARDMGAIEFRDDKWVGVNFGAKPANT